MVNHIETTWQILFASVLLALIAQVHGVGVPLTLVEGAVEKGAVCLDGSPAGYHYAPGSGDGVNNWIVHLMGGGWCSRWTCHYRMNNSFGSTKPVGDQHFGPFGGILNPNQTVNPDFYNWNRVYVRYCDGSSFLGDTEGDSNGHPVQLRGSKIFSAVMDELLQKGMKDAKNAILSGASAGGLACILHCDGFRSLIPNTARVKCVPDSGFFIHGKNLPYIEFREQSYAEVVKFSNLTDFLPTTCTSKRNASLCLFPEYLVGDIQTPIFLLNPIFDFYQLRTNLRPISPNEEGWNGTCIIDETKSIDIPTAERCTPPQWQLVKDFGVAFLDAINGLGDNPSRGLFINACYGHVFTESAKLWTGTPCKLGDKTVQQAVGDWYFDRSPVKLISKSDVPTSCPNYGAIRK